MNKKLLMLAFSALLTTSAFADYYIAGGYLNGVTYSNWNPSANDCKFTETIKNDDTTGSGTYYWYGSSINGNFKITTGEWGEGNEFGCGGVNLSPFHSNAQGAYSNNQTNMNISSLVTNPVIKLYGYTSQSWGKEIKFELTDRLLEINADDLGLDSTKKYIIFDNTAAKWAEPVIYAWGSEVFGGWGDSKNSMTKKTIGNYEFWIKEYESLESVGGIKIHDKNNDANALRFTNISSISTCQVFNPLGLSDTEVKFTAAEPVDYKFYFASEGWKLYTDLSEEGVDMIPLSFSGHTLYGATVSSTAAPAKYWFEKDGAKVGEFTYDAANTKIYNAAGNYAGDLVGDVYTPHIGPADPEWWGKEGYFYAVFDNTTPIATTPKVYTWATDGTELCGKFGSTQMEKVTLNGKELWVYRVDLKGKTLSGLIFNGSKGQTNNITGDNLVSGRVYSYSGTNKSDVIYNEAIVIDGVYLPNGIPTATDYNFYFMNTEGWTSVTLKVGDEEVKMTGNFDDTKALYSATLSLMSAPEKYTITNGKATVEDLTYDGYVYNAAKNKVGKVVDNKYVPFATTNIYFVNTNPEYLGIKAAINGYDNGMIMTKLKNEDGDEFYKATFLTENAPIHYWFYLYGNAECKDPFDATGHLAIADRMTDGKIRVYNNNLNQNDPNQGIAGYVINGKYYSVGKEPVSNDQVRVFFTNLKMDGTDAGFDVSKLAFYPFVNDNNKLCDWGQAPAVTPVPVKWNGKTVTLYSAVFDKKYTYVIFKDGKEQTGDLMVVDNGVYYADDLAHTSPSLKVKDGVVINSHESSPFPVTIFATYTGIAEGQGLKVSVKGNSDKGYVDTNPAYENKVPMDYVVINGTPYYKLTSRALTSLKEVDFSFDVTDIEGVTFENAKQDDKDATKTVVNFDYKNEKDSDPNFTPTRYMIFNLSTGDISVMDTDVIPEDNQVVLQSFGCLTIENEETGENPGGTYYMNYDANRGVYTLTVKTNTEYVDLLAQLEEDKDFDGMPLTPFFAEGARGFFILMNGMDGLGISNPTKNILHSNSIYTMAASEEDMPYGLIKDGRWYEITYDYRAQTIFSEWKGASAELKILVDGEELHESDSNLKAVYHARHPEDTNHSFIISVTGDGAFIEEASQEQLADKLSISFEPVSFDRNNHLLLDGTNTYVAPVESAFEETETSKGTFESKVRAEVAGVYKLTVTFAGSDQLNPIERSCFVGIRPTAKSIGLSMNWQNVDYDADSDPHTFAVDMVPEKFKNTKFTTASHVPSSSVAIYYKFGKNETANSGIETVDLEENYRVARAAAHPTHDGATSTEGYTLYTNAIDISHLYDTEDNENYTLKPEYDKDNLLQLVVKQNGMTSEPITITANDDVKTSVATIEAAAADAVYFNLQGVQMDSTNLAPGIYIQVKAGKSTKVVIK